MKKLTQHKIAIGEESAANALTIAKSYRKNSGLRKAYLECAVYAFSDLARLKQKEKHHAAKTVR